MCSGEKRRTLSMRTTLSRSFRRRFTMQQQAKKFLWFKRYIITGWFAPEEISFGKAAFARTALGVPLLTGL